MSIGKGGYSVGVSLRLNASKSDIQNQINSLGKLSVYADVKPRSMAAVRLDIQRELRSKPFDINIRVARNKVIDNIEKDTSSSVHKKSAKEINDQQAIFRAQREELADHINQINREYRRLLKAEPAAESKFKDVARSVRDIRTEFEKFKVGKTPIGDEEIRTLKEKSTLLREQIELHNKAAAASAKESKENITGTNQVLALRKRMERFLDKNTKSARDKIINPQVSSMIGELSSEAGVPRKKYDSMRAEFARMEEYARKSQKLGMGIADTIGDAYKRFGGWMIITRTASAAFRQAKEMIVNVKQIDLAMTELKKVTDETDATYAKFVSNAIDRTRILGATLSDTIQATADFARLGYSIEEASSLADVALVYKNVGDGIDNVTEASESIISTLKGFGIEASDAINVVDKFNEVGNNFAISSKGIGEASKRSAAAMHTAGNTLDETIALATAANAVTQDPEKVGTALKTVSMFLRAAKTEAVDAGISTDGMATSVSELREEILALTGGKVDIQLDEDTFKSTYQILKELSIVWDDLTDTTRANILERLAGKRQGNIVASILKNFAIAESALATSIDAAGSAMKENEKYLDSIKGKSAIQSAAFEGLSKELVNEEAVKGIIDLSTAVINMLTKITQKGGSITTIMGAIVGAFSAISAAKGKDSLFNFFDVFDGKVKVVGGFAKNISDIQQAMMDMDMPYLQTMSKEKASFEAFKMAINPKRVEYMDTIDEYNKRVAIGGDEGLRQTRMFAEAVATNDEVMGGYLRKLDGASASMEGFATSSMEAGKALASFSVADKVANAAVGVLNTMMNMATGMLIGMAVNEIFKGINSIFTAFDRMREEARDASEKATLASEEVSQLSQQYLGMKDSVELGSGSREELMGIQSQLISRMAEEGVAVDALRDKYATLDEAIAAGGRSIMENAVNSAAVNYSYTIDDIINKVNLDQARNPKGYTFSLETHDAESFVKQINKDLGTKLFIDNGKVTMKSGMLQHGDHAGLVELSRELNRIREYATQYRGTEDDLTRQLMVLTDDVAGMLGEATEQRASLMNNMVRLKVQVAANDKKMPQSQEDFDAFFEGLIVSLRNDSRVGGATRPEAMASIREVMSEMPLYSKYLVDFEKREQDINDALGRRRILSKELSDDIKGRVEVAAELFKMSDDAVAHMYERYDSGAINSLEDMRIELELFNVRQAEAEGKARAMSDAIMMFFNSDQAKPLMDEIEKIEKSVDGLTKEKLITLFSPESKFMTEQLNELLKETGMNAGYLANIFLTQFTGGDGLSLISDEVLLLNDALDGMRGKLDDAGEAYRRYQEKLSGREYDTNYKNYAEAYQAMTDELEKGREGSLAFTTAAEFIFGEDWLAQWDYDTSKIVEKMQEIKPMFEDGEDAGQGFLWYLNSLEKQGKLIDENGQKIMEIKELADGSLDWNIDGDNIDKLAKKLNLTEDAVRSMFEALAVYGDVSFMDMDEVLETIDKIGASAEINGEKVISLDRVLQMMETGGRTGKEINEVRKALMALEGVTLIDLGGDVDEVINSLTQLRIATKDMDGKGIRIDTAGIETYLQYLGYTNDEIEELYDKLSQDVRVKFSYQGELITPEDAKARLHVDTDGADEATGVLKRLKDKLTEVQKTNMSPLRRQLDSVSSSARSINTQLSYVIQKISLLSGKKINLLVNPLRPSGGTTTSGSRKLPRFGSNVMENRFAKGTDDAKGGLALVGEEGPELIQTDGRAYVAGVGGPEIVDLAAGDVVYTNEETTRIFGIYGSKIFGSFPRFAQGRASGRTKPVKQADAEKAQKAPSTSKEAKETEDALKDANKEFEALLSKMEHAIFLLSKQNGTLDQIIDKYREMQRLVHEKANAYRAEGLAEDSEEIMDLQKKWWGYQDAIMQAIEQDFSKRNEKLEAAISLANRIIDDAVNKQHLNLAEAQADTAVAAYRHMQLAVKEQLDYLRREGYDEMSAEILKLKEVWWGYEADIRAVKESVIERLKEMVKGTSALVDEVQNVKSTLMGVAKEYSENNGYIYVDSLQKIFDLGAEYMQMLEDENGNLVINKDRIDQIIMAKTRQLAVDHALAYVERLRLAMQEDSIESLNRLLFATTEATDATWGFVYASLDMLGLNNEQYAAAAHNIDTIRSLAENAIEGVAKISDESKDELSRMKTSLDDLLKYVMEMLKHRIKQQVDALKEMRRTYADIVGLRKESLRLAKEESDHQDKVAEKVKEIGKLQEKVYALSLDDSREAHAEKTRLEEDLVKMQKELDDTQSDYALSNQEATLDKMQKSYEKQKDEEIKVLEDTISSHQKLYDMAIAYIQDNWSTLYGELIAWNTEYGTSLNSDITKAWEDALRAAQEYGDYLSALNALSGDGSLAGKGGAQESLVIGKRQNNDRSFTQQDSIHAVVKEMYRNSNTWMAADDGSRRNLSDRNAQLAAMLSQYGVRAVRGDDGVWYIDRVGGQKLYDKYRRYTYHTGGVAGDMPTMRQNEILAMLERGELILNKRKEDVLYNALRMSSMMVKNFSDNMPNMNTQTNVYRQLATETGGASIHFGDVIINGGDKSTIEEHKKINRDFTNEVLRFLNIRR